MTTIFQIKGATLQIMVSALLVLHVCAEYSVKPNISGSQSEVNSSLTDFLDLGLDREEAVMLDLFRKNILYVAESKFSTAKHLQDVWRAMKMEICWLDRTHLMLARLHERRWSE